MNTCVNALNGLSSFLHLWTVYINATIGKWCQRPERAFFISTNLYLRLMITILQLCQRPERAFFISTEGGIFIMSNSWFVSTP